MSGAGRSRDPQAVLAGPAAEAEAEPGTSPLLGQNVNSYGNDLDLNYHFPDLLADIDRIRGISHPLHVPATKGRHAPAV